MFNGDNMHTRELYKGSEVQDKLLYATEGVGDIKATNIKVLDNGLEFTVVYKNTRTKIITPMVGKHNVSNILAAITVALKVRMNMKDIKKAVETLTPFDKTLKTYSGIYDSTLIDDTYSANPDGVFAALEYLHLKEGNKKIVIIPSMIELGTSASLKHRELGAKLVAYADIIFYTSTDHRDELLEGAGMMKDKIIFMQDPKKIHEALKKMLETNDVVLFESRGTEVVLEQLKK